MAATITLDSSQDGRSASGDRFIRRGTINLGSYATNGVAVTKANFDLPVALNDLDIGPTAGYVFEWDKTNGKVKAYDQKDPAAAGGADIALPEVGNGVNLTTIVARFRAEGQ